MSQPLEEIGRLSRLLSDEQKKVARIAPLLKRLAWYYEVNDCHEKPHDNALEVPIADLREALSWVIAEGETPAP